MISYERIDCSEVTFFLTVKNIDYRVYIANVNKKAAVYILNNSVLKEKSIL